MRAPVTSATGFPVVTGIGLACMLSWSLLVGGCKAPLSAGALRPALDDGVDISDIQGPTERELQSISWEERRERLKASGVEMEGLAEFEAAQRFFDAGEFRAAETAFEQLAKQRARAGTTWQSRWQELFAREKSPADLYGGYGDPIEEDALYMVAESQFAQEKYSWAQDSYGSLLEKYPSTRHLDGVTRRLFYIAQVWLDVPTTAPDANDVELVSLEEDGSNTPNVDVHSGPAHWPVTPNLVDRTRPVFDTDGRALQALETVWRKDASGPLADDALMLQATYYHRKGDYVEAARLYKLVRDQYPESQHFQDAFLLGSHVTLASYTGPEYEGATLEESRNLKQTARQMFVNLNDEQKQRLDSELERIAEAEVERLWTRVEFYRWKNQPASVALYCNIIISDHPNSPYAQRARELLAEQQQRGGQADASLLTDVPQPASPGTFGSLPEAKREREEPGFIDRLLRRTDEPPDLQPVEPESNDQAETASEPEDKPARIAL
jgi:TolA-binding protein